MNKKKNIYGRNGEKMGDSFFSLTIFQYIGEKMFPTLLRHAGGLEFQFESCEPTSIAFDLVFYRYSRCKKGVVARWPS